MKNSIAQRYAVTRGRAAAMVVGASILATAVLTGIASAATLTGTPITSGFASAQTSLLVYMGLAVGLVIALVLAGAGIRFLAKWIKLAVSKN